MSLLLKYLDSHKRREMYQVQRGGEKKMLVVGGLADIQGIFGHMSELCAHTQRYTQRDNHVYMFLHLDSE